MRIGSRNSFVKPRTVVGEWLAAGLLNQREQRRLLARRLNGGKEGWNYDEPAVIEVACELAVRRYFKGVANSNDISNFVREMRSKIHSVSPPDQREAETLVRLSLGDVNVSVSDIRDVNIISIQSAVVGQVVKTLQLAEKDVLSLISSAEKIAFERGWNPPLAK